LPAKVRVAEPVNWIVPVPVSVAFMPLYVNPLDRDRVPVPMANTRVVVPVIEKLTADSVWLLRFSVPSKRVAPPETPPTVMASTNCHVADPENVTGHPNVTPFEVIVFAAPRLLRVRFAELEGIVIPVPSTMLPRTWKNDPKASAPVYPVQSKFPIVPVDADSVTA
jgi:hypothetical protein